MNKNTVGHLQFVGWGVVILVLFGLVIDEVALVLAVGFGAYLIWSVRQALRLHNWLYRDDGRHDIPESFGMWGDLFEGLYRLQRKNELSEAHLKSMIERVRTSTNALKEAVILTNTQGEMDWWNDAAQRMFGFQETKDQGQLLTNLVRDPAFKQYFVRREYDQALDISSPFDPNLRLRMQITQYGEGERLIISQDITRVHQLEQMRRDFVSNVSHEMRTPLTVIHGYLETLSDADDLPKKWRRPINSMITQTQRLDVLVSDLLLLEKYESSDNDASDKLVDVNKLLNMVCHDAELFSGDSNHRIRLKSEVSVGVVGDESQLRSAFSNLVFNAVKYTHDEGEIDVNAWQDESGLHVSVRDNGCGFDPIHIPRLTERFYRADPSRNVNTGGSGLGLAIVKHALINHRGSLDIQSAINEGSEFTCHFPLASLQTLPQSQVSVGA